MKETILERLVRLIEESEYKESNVCEYIGISPSKLSNWKARHTVPDVLTLSRAADFFGISLNYLINGLGEISPEDEDLSSAIELLHKDRRYRVLLDKKIRGHFCPLSTFIYYLPILYGLFLSALPVSAKNNAYF